MAEPVQSEQQEEPKDVTPPHEEHDAQGENHERTEKHPANTAEHGEREGHDDDRDNDADEELEDEDDEGDDEEGDEEEGEIDESLLRDRKRLWQTISGKPLEIAEVLVTGNARTREDVITRELSEAMAASQFGEMQAALARGYEALQGLGIFEEINVYVDSGPDDVAGTATVHVDVVERGVFSANIGTYVQGKEQTMELKGTLKNMAGRAESLHIHAGTGVNSSAPSAFSLGIVLPRALYSLAGPPPREGGWRGVSPLGAFLRSATLEARLAESTRSWREFSSFSERNMGGVVSLSSGAHQFSYNTSWRENWSGASCSPAVRRELGHSLLSSLRYEYVRDRRNSRARPSRGYYFRSTSELAGVGLDANLVRFFRQEFELAFAHKLHRATGLTLTGGCHVGALFPWNLPGKYAVGGSGDPSTPCGRPPLINDRFFLGGPSSLRGFRMHGVGPTDFRSRAPSQPGDATREESVDFLGGDLVASAGLGLAFDVPVRTLRAMGVHGHVFTAVGSLVPLAALAPGGRVPGGGSGGGSGGGGMGSFDSSWAAGAAEAIKSRVRWTCGGGLVWPTVFGRLEVNYCMAMKRSENDIIPKHGFEFGINTSPY